MVSHVDPLVRGTDFGSFDDALEACQFPVTSDELVACLGRQELGLGGEATRIADALGGLDATFSSPREARDALRNEIGTDALGREHASDRSREYPTRARRSPFKEPGEI